MAKRKQHGKQGWCTPQREAAGLGVGTIVLVIVILAGVGVFSPHSSSSAPPFYADPSQLIFHYPLTSNYLDVSGHTTGALLNTSTRPPCTPSFVTGVGWLNPCSGNNQAVVLSPPMALTMPYAFSAWTMPLVAPDLSALLGSNLGSNPITSSNGIYAEADSGGYLTVVLSGTRVYGGTVRFQPNVPVHVVVCADETLGYAVYRNGTLVSSGAVPDTSPATQPLPLTIGNSIIPGSDEDFTLVGIMRSVRMFTRYLTSAEAAELYAVDAQ